MTNDDLKKYSVIVGDGSGCLFQPMTEEYTYVLTAKHLFYEEIEIEEGRPKVKQLKPDGTVINIIRQLKTKTGWEDAPIQFTLLKGENYFEHEEADGTILKIQKQDDYFDNIHIDLEFTKISSYRICGFPNTYRENDEGERFLPLSINDITSSGNYSQGCQLDNFTLNQTNIEGMSGGGVLKLCDTYNSISIIGIQSKMASMLLPSGQIAFVPVKYFNEIIGATENIDKLVKLCPPFMGSFKSIQEGVFKLQVGILGRYKAEKISETLKAKSNIIATGNITPIDIKEYIKENIALTYNQSRNQFKNKKIWQLWFELLTILSVLEISSNDKGSIPEVLSKFRLFYSESNEDYWLNNLNKLHKKDYSGLNSNGIVVVATNVKADDDFHLLDLSKIPGNITSGYKDDFELDKIGGRIDSAELFPLEKFKFVNISAFKEGIVKQVNNDFTNSTPIEILNKLKELYEGIIYN